MAIERCVCVGRQHRLGMRIVDDCRTRDANAFLQRLTSIYIDVAPSSGKIYRPAADVGFCCGVA
jgi:hypothetical protein